MSDEKEIIVNINSQGGDVFSGVAIYNMLRRQNAHITVNIDFVITHLYHLLHYL
nr:ATP-dependent Clp protease proteolytic subunit [Staphylococcus arlettae]